MKRDWTSRSTILLVGLIIVVVNLIGLNLFQRFDLTDDGVYSLSDASIDLVKELEDPVTITAYFTDNLPAPYSGNRRFLKDKLDDYRAYGGRNLQYRFIDPGEDEDMRGEAGRYGIPPVQIQVIESDNVQLKNAWMGVAIEYGGEREVVPVVQDLSTLEYDITSAIRRLTRDGLPVIGFLTGHGEPDPTSAYQSLQQQLSRNYTVKPITIEAGAMTERPEALLVVAPTDTIPNADLRALDEYVQLGGRIAFLINRVTADLQSGQAQAISVGLESLLRPWGMGLTEDLVMDRQSGAITVQRQQGFFQLAQQVDYPFFPIVRRFSPDNMMVNRLRDVMLYYASSVDTSIVLPAGVDREMLAYTSNQAGRQQDFFMVQPMMQPIPLEDGPFVLAAAYTGAFPSVFDTGRTSLPSRVVLVGDGDFLNESIVGAIPGNINLGMNLVDWLVQDEALLSIRSKSVAPRVLDPVSDGLRPWIKYGTMIGPVLLIVFFGLSRWRRRRGRQYILVR